MSIRHMKKEHRNTRFLILYYSNLLTQACFNFRRRGQLTSSEHAKCTFIITFVCLSVPHTVVAYFEAAKFSIKRFSFIYFIAYVVRQRVNGNEYEIMTEMRPIKTT